MRRACGANPDGFRAFAVQAGAAALVAEGLGGDGLKPGFDNFTPEFEPVSCKNVGS